jgi:hypothetical protein
MGVDYGGSGPLYAIGSGTITSVRNAGWPGGAFIGLHLDSGQYVYYAEDITAHVHVGQRVSAGQLVGTATGGPSGIEVGWAAAPGTGSTLAAASGQAAPGSDPGAHPTAYGVSFNNLIKSLGGPGGIVSGPVTGSIPPSLQAQYGAGAGAGSTGGLGSLAGIGCVPLIGLAWVMTNAIREKKKSRRHISRRQRRYWRRKDEVGKQRGSRPPNEIASRHRTRDETPETSQDT